MIYFETNHQKLFNYLIHHFLEIEFFEFPEEIDLSWYLPEKFLEENQEKCLQTIEELYNWTDDNTEEELGPFHEYILSHFIDEISDFQEDLEDFNDIYFDDKALKLMDLAIQEDYKNDEDAEFMTYKEYKKEMLELYQDVHIYPDYLFRDLDCRLIDKIYNNHKDGNLFLEKRLGIDLDYYFELLPKDIQNQYKTGHIYLYGDLKEMILLFQQRIEYGSLSKLFWNNSQPKNLNQIEILLDNLITSYFINQEIELTWTSTIKDNTLNFTFIKRLETEKHLISFQLPIFSKLTKELREDFFKICKNYEHCDFIFLCFNDEDYNKVVEFIENYIYTQTIRYYLNIYVYDLRAKISPSKKKKR